MKMVDSALWTYILKVLGQLLRPGSGEVNAIFDKLGRKPDWKELRALILKSQRQELNRAE